MKRERKVGDYLPIVQRNGKIRWDVQLEEGDILCERQEDAEIISRLVKIEQMLRKCSQAGAEFIKLIAEERKQMRKWANQRE